MHGNRRRIPDYRLVAQDKINHAQSRLNSFHRTATPTDINAIAARRDVEFEILRSRRRYTFAICLDFEDPQEPTVGERFGSFAATCMNARHMGNKPGNDPGWRIFTFLNFQRLAQLRQDDLNGSERMSLEWDVANTVKSSPHGPWMRCVLTGEIDRTRGHARYSLLLRT